MAGSASGQDEANPVFWFWSRAGKIGPSCPLGIARFVPAKAKLFGVIFWPYNKSFIDQAWGQDGWISASFFLRFYGPRLRLGPQKRKKELGQYPAILTSRLVNNACVFLRVLLYFYELYFRVHLLIQYKQVNTICTTYLSSMAWTERVCRGREETHWSLHETRTFPAYEALLLYLWFQKFLQMNLWTTEGNIWSFHVQVRFVKMVSSAYTVIPSFSNADNSFAEKGFTHILLPP